MEPANHVPVKIASGNIYREHAGSVPYPKNLLSGKLIMHITCQCGKESNLLYMFFFV